jgi:hypothetical protein
VAAVSVIAWRGGPSVGLLVGAEGAETADEELVKAWLSQVHRSSPVLVPGPLRARMGGASALAVPLRTPSWRVGALALPLSTGWGPIARELEALGLEFARRFHTAERRSQIAWLRIAVTAPRPTSRFRVSVVGDRVFAPEPGPRTATRLRPSMAHPVVHRAERSTVAAEAVGMPLAGRR